MRRAPQSSRQRHILKGTDMTFYPPFHPHRGPSTPDGQPRCGVMHRPTSRGLQRLSWLILVGVSLVVVMTACGGISAASPSGGHATTSPSGGHTLAPTYAPSVPVSPSHSASATPSPTTKATPDPTLTPPVPVGTQGPSQVPIPSHAPTPSLGPANANNPLGVAKALFPKNAQACGAQKNNYDACPVTAALAKRLNENPVPGAQPLCRCNNPITTPTWTEESMQVPDTADTVNVVLPYYQDNIDISIAVAKNDGTWQATDIWCTSMGEAKSSIFVSSPPLCP